MPGSDPPHLPAEMLRDLGRAGSKIEAGDDRLHQIMRLADDPLLLHAWLRRERCPGPQLPVPLLRPVLPNQMGGLAKGTSSASVYTSQILAPSESLHPEVFAASAEDRAAALDTVVPASRMKWPGMGAWLVFLLATSLLPVVILMLL